jgi:pimeloyl-ACP methyl ester carboxylesterase
MSINIELTGSGQKILFIHGSGCNSSIWYRQRDYLEKSMEVVLLDLPGHGASAGDGCDTVELYSQAVHTAMEKVGKEPYYVVGHSLGGAIAMTLALTFPHTIRGLVLIGSGARLRVLPSILTGVLEDSLNTLPFINSQSFAQNTSTSIKEAGLQIVMKCRPEVIYRDFNACDHFDIMSSTSSITVPSLIICGSEDALTPAKYSRYLADNLTKAQLLIIQGAGHMAMMEKPEEINGAIEGFCGKGL